MCLTPSYTCPLVVLFWMLCTKKSLFFLTPPHNSYHFFYQKNPHPILYQTTPR